MALREPATREILEFTKNSSEVEPIARHENRRAMFGLANGQRGTGTRRVDQVEHARARANPIDTSPRLDSHEKRDRTCPAVPAGTPLNLHGKEWVNGSSPLEGCRKCQQMAAQLPVYEDAGPWGTRNLSPERPQVRGTHPDLA